MKSLFNKAYRCLQDLWKEASLEQEVPPCIRLLVAVEDQAELSSVSFLSPTPALDRNTQPRDSIAPSPRSLGPKRHGHAVLV